MSWFAGFEQIVRVNAPLHELTWYRLGGSARWLCEPRDEDELSALLERITEAGVAWRVLGRGANIIVRDEGFDGAVIHLTGPVFERVDYEEEPHNKTEPRASARAVARTAQTPNSVQVRVGAAADLPKLLRAALNHGLVGLEVLAGIPGTVGGAVRMNAGGRYGEIGQFVREIRVLEPDGRIVTRPAAEVGFAYRHTDLQHCIVLSATLALQRGDAEQALERHREIWNEKYASQPPLAERTSGCIFRNPSEQPAGLLLDQSGMKGVRVGGAEISTRHANFIVAHDDATAADVLELIALAKERVRAATGIELEPEVEIW